MEIEERLTASSEFGSLLRRLRLAAGLSQEALAERARMSSDGVSALERGHRRCPQRETLALLAGALALTDEQRREFEAAAARPSLPRHSASVTVGPWPDAAAVDLPLSLNSFVGRDNELAEIASLVREHRLVTLTGTGGVGKTQTALRVALSDDVAVRFVGFAAIGDPNLVVAAIAAALGVQEVSTSPLLETVSAYLKNRTMLLVLDNCEHLIAEVAKVAGKLLSDCRHIRMLATSREPLKAAGEYVYRLSSLDSSSSVTLFSDRARAADHHVTLSDENAPFVAEICQRLDGIPLAIELAAARVNVLSVPSLAQRLNERFKILTAGSRIAPPRQQTMRAAIDWSYALLSAQEQCVFNRLSIFAGGWTLDFARNVCSSECINLDMLEILSSLLDKSLIAAHLGLREARYSLLETFRQYGREKLQAQSEFDKIARRHALTYLDFAKQMQDAQHQGQPHSNDVVLAEFDNWRAAIDWALTACKDVALGQQLVAELGSVWLRFAFAEGHQRVRMALAIGDKATPDTMASLTMAAASFSYELNEVKTALDLAERALALYQRANDTVGIARAQSFIGQCLVFTGRREEAEHLLAKVLEATSTFDRPMLRGGALQTIAWSRAMSGNILEARLHFGEALLTYKRLNATNAAAGVYLNLAEAEFFAGNTDVALQTAGRALQIFREQKDGLSITNVLGNISAYNLAAENWDEARTYAHDELCLAQRLDLDVHIAWALQRLAGTLVLPASGRGSSENEARAARILGFVNAKYAALDIVQAPTEAREYQRILSKLEESLERNQLTALMSEGKMLSQAEVLELV